MKDDIIYRQAAIDALGERPMTWVGGDYELGVRNQYDADVLALETVPSVDAVPVVRCKDCKHNPEKARFGCPMAGTAGRRDDDYCSFWDRRDDE